MKTVRSKASGVPCQLRILVLCHSQFQLGKLLSVSDKAVSKWENGDAKPRLATCSKLAEILGVFVNELLSAANSTKNDATQEVCIRSRGSHFFSIGRQRRPQIFAVLSSAFLRFSHKKFCICMQNRVRDAKKEGP